MKQHEIIFNKKSYKVSEGDTIEDFINNNSITTNTVAAALLNGRLTRLDQLTPSKSRLELVDLNSYQGRKIYENSVIFSFLVCFDKLFPNVKVFIQHSIQHGIYVEVDGIELSKPDIQRISEEMIELAKSKKRINSENHDWHLYQEHLESKNRKDIFRLFRYSSNSEFKVYELNGFEEYFDIPIMTTTEHLNKFELQKYQNGLILILPASDGKTIPKFEDRPKLFKSYQESHTWSRLLKVRTVGQLNQYIMSGEIDDLIKVAEALHEKKIAMIADMITKSEFVPRLVMIAGPTSSGKTTFSKRLGVQLQVNNFTPFTLSMDNYFVDREKTPKDINGDYNFEDIGAIDITLFMDHVSKLLDGKEVEIPRFDFHTGKRKKSNPDNVIKLEKNHIIVIEGIHGLNPELTKNIDDKHKFKIYIAALTQLNIHRHKRIQASDTRLIRRIVRDSIYRGYSASDTLNRWTSVRDGEKQNIFPLQEEADVVFNSALFYEMSILKGHAKKELLRVTTDDPMYVESQRLLKFLSHFIRLEADDVPTTSILKEFIGGSSFSY